MTQPNIKQAISTFRKTAKQLLRTADIIQRHTQKNTGTGMKRRADRITKRKVTSIADKKAA